MSKNGFKKNFEASAGDVVALMKLKRAAVAAVVLRQWRGVVPVASHIIRRPRIGATGITPAIR